MHCCTLERPGNSWRGLCLGLILGKESFKGFKRGGNGVFCPSPLITSCGFVALTSPSVTQTSSGVESGHRWPLLLLLRSGGWELAGAASSPLAVQTRTLGHPGMRAFGALSAWNSGEPAEQPDSFTCCSEAYPSDTFNPGYDPPVTEIRLPSLNLSLACSGSAP